MEELSKPYTKIQRQKKTHVFKFMANLGSSLSTTKQSRFFRAEMNGMGLNSKRFSFP